MLRSHFSRSIVKRFAFEVDSQDSWAQRKWVMVLHLSWAESLNWSIWFHVGFLCNAAKKPFIFNRLAIERLEWYFSMMQKTGDFSVWGDILIYDWRTEMKWKPKQNTSVKHFVRVKVIYRRRYLINICDHRLHNKIMLQPNNFSFHFIY